MKQIAHSIKRIFFDGPIPLAAVVGIVLLTVVGVIFVIRRNPQILGLSPATTPKQEGQVASEQEVKLLIAKVGKLVFLPEGETPTVATVTDVNQVKNQPFFQNAQNGDKVLVYTTIKKAFLYRPSIDKVIDMAPVNIGTSSASGTTGPVTAPQASPTPLTASPAPAVDTVALKAKVILYNGTATTGLTKTYEQELKAKAPSVGVLDRDTAKKHDYARTILIDISGTKKALGEQLAQVLGIKVAEMPAGESATPSADFLIIVGADKAK